MQTDCSIRQYNVTSCIISILTILFSPFKDLQVFPPCNIEKTEILQIVQKQHKAHAATFEETKVAIWENSVTKADAKKKKRHRYLALWL